MPKDLDSRLRDAIREFWRIRARQAKKQGSKSGNRDAGARTAVTGGRQMDGFVRLVTELLAEYRVPKEWVFFDQSLELPGFYRAEKRWDLLVVSEKRIVAAVEFKSHIGPSFGNNFNNRTEEALGSATDLLAAYREGAFSPSPKPWLGYLMLLEDSPGSNSPVSVKEPHFEVFPEFKDASYAERYQLLLTRLVRERLYDAACFLKANAEEANRGAHSQPSSELSFEGFVDQLLQKAVGATKPTR